jgi:hypothetical protein
MNQFYRGPLSSTTETLWNDENAKIKDWGETEFKNL